MRCVCAVVCTIAVLFGCASTVTAQAPADLFNPQIEIEYATPTNADLLPVKERLEARKVLETFRQFMAPLKLPQKLTIKFADCGGVMNVRSRAKATATICYDFVAEIRRLAPTGPVQLVQTSYTTARLGPESPIIGPVVQALLRETAIAALDMLEIPVWGRKEDAADRVAALIMLRFNEEHVAWNTIVGTAWFLAGSALAPMDLSDVRGTMAQRYYTTVCIAFGARPATFKTFVREYREYRDAAAGDLPLARALGCRDEYATLLNAFNGVIAPKHVDTALLRKVVATKWINFFE
jgi:hypothetical protein